MAPAVHPDTEGVADVKLICAECGVEFDWDESPSDERCAECAMRRAHYCDEDEGAA